MHGMKACTRVELQLLSLSASALGTETLPNNETLKCFSVTVSIIIWVNDEGKIIVVVFWSILQPSICVLPMLTCFLVYDCGLWKFVSNLIS
jgi:hypothetical protein